MFVPEEEDGHPLPSTNLRGGSDRNSIISTDSANLEGYNEANEDKDEMFLLVSTNSK